MLKEETEPSPRPIKKKKRKISAISASKPQSIQKNVIGVVCLNF
jgi:hypothetical protein